MNYRHIYHAGGACDVVKHAALALLAEKMRAKDKKFAVLDTHAGDGLYNLSDPRARATGEAQEGVLRFWAAKDAADAALGPYLGVLRALNPGEKLTVYPGSPALVRHFLREQDRLIACEKHPEDARILRQTFKDDPRIQPHARDGYLAINAFLPFPEKRGLVLIDPPFEEPDEFDRLAGAVRMLHARMPGARGVFWYPIKDQPAIRLFHETLAAGLGEILVAEFLFCEARAGKLSGSGLVFLNAPWKFEDTLTALFTSLHALLETESHESRIEVLNAA